MPIPHLQGWFSASVPKAGNRGAENEDAVAADIKRVRFALADGATEGWQSRTWANHLAQAYIRKPPGPPDFHQWLADLRKSWTPPAPKSEHWYAEAKQEQGSFATILGLEFRRATDSSGLIWKAVAVGDTCLFVVRGNTCEPFPINSADEFGNQPPLVPSSTDRDCPDPEWLAGWAEPGDLFLLATDAVARFILQSQEPREASPIVQAAKLGVASGMSKPMVDLLGKLRTQLNDDASVIAVRVADAK
ncbi:MAG TPA: protein phosphatase 2C domain-containing protein [Urbifossiella sp.]|jgi:hypothetical protein